MKWIAWLLCAGLYVGTTQAAGAAEICGNGKDDDGNDLADEGCYAPLRTGLCESPLSCADTGWVSWSTGSLHYAVPPDIAPKSPYGPDIAFRRFYTSMYAPGSTSSPVNRTPLGNRWQHNYMSWIAPASEGRLVIHTPQGDDLLAYPALPNNPGVHELQPGKGPYASLRESGSPGAIEYELRTKTGEALIYNNAGHLVEIRDTVAAPNTNKVRITWTSNASTGGWVVDTVSDTTLKRRLSFNYSGGLLYSVRFQLSLSGIWTTVNEPKYDYAARNLTSVTIGGQLVQTNTYTNGLLTQIQDGGGTQIVAFQYSPTTPGETRLIDTEDGTLGFDFAPDPEDRGTCSAHNQTVLYFNKSNANSCTSDGGCGSGSLCSGKEGSPGGCFRAARCLTHSASGEGLVTGVHALTIGSESCTGACAEVIQYAWGSLVPTDPKALDLAGTVDAGGGTTNVQYENGMPTRITYPDPDGNAPNSASPRTVYLYYDATHPGRLREVRRATNLPMVSSMDCTYDSTSGCARTLFDYDPATGKLASTTQKGWTLAGGEPTFFSYTTTRTYDAEGRLRSVDGPLDGPEEYDITTYTYHDAPTDPLIHGFLKSRSRVVRGEPDWWTLTEYVNEYDKWGNAIDWLEVDGTRSCRTYDAARNYLKTAREKMGDQASASCAEHATDIVELFTRDSALRLTKAQSGDGSCVVYEYDGKGRLARTKRRDDCLGSSPGDREEYTYDHDGLLTGVDTYNAAGAVTHKAMAAYHDSRRRQSIINPVDVTKRQSFSYDERGALTTIDGEGDLSKTELSVDADYRTTRIAEVIAEGPPRIEAPWNLTSTWLGQPANVTDPDGKVLTNIYDDLGRLVSSQTSTNTFTPHNRIHTSTDPMQERRFSYDFLGRLVYADLDRCPSGLPQIINYWDEHPFCEIPGGCQNTKGRLAGTSVTLMCDGPGEVRQMTSYSYDAAGRVVTEHIKDNNDPPRIVSQTYAWTKGGQLAQVTLPSSTVLGWTYGSTASNSDTDRLTAQWRTSPSPENFVTHRILWNPYGPLKQFDRMDVISGSALRMRYDYNLAYRPRSLALEGQTLGGPYYSLTLAEDAKGRITKRDYFPSDESNPPLTGVFDSYFHYDRQEHVLCETTTPVTNCQSAASNVIKNSFPDGLTGAGDRTTLLRPIPGTVNGMSSLFKFGFGNHQIGSVDQSVLGKSTYHHDDRGNRRLEGGGSLATHALRQYDYDSRGNLVRVSGTYPVGSGWNQYAMRSAFDGRNRRVYKSFKDLATGQEQRWFFYYDALDRLTEVHYHHDSVVTTYQLFWLGDLLTAYWQTESNSTVPTKRYVETDETGRPVRLRRWEPGPSKVDWAINPDAWGMDPVVVGKDVYQPIVFAGQYRDSETTSYLNDGVTVHRPGLVLNGFRTYDPFTGSYLQRDPLVAKTWDAYGYADGNPVGRIDPSGLRDETIYVRDPWFGHVWLPLTEPSLGGLFAWFTWGGGGTGEGGGGGDGDLLVPEPPKAPKKEEETRTDHEICGPLLKSCFLSECRGPSPSPEEVFDRRPYREGLPGYWDAGMDGYMRQEAAKSEAFGAVLNAILKPALNTGAYQKCMKDRANSRSRR